MHKPALFLSCLLLTLLYSCKDTGDRQETFFDSLVVSQINHLTDAKASVSKRASMGGKESRSKFVPDAVHWKNELDIFRQLALFERISYQQAYRVESGLRDNKSNLLVKRYTATEDVPVPELKFYYLHDFKNLRKIEAVYHQTNALYATRRRLVMEFDESKDGPGKPQLMFYSIEGSEKMIFADSLRFSVFSEIEYNTKKIPDASLK